MKALLATLCTATLALAPLAAFAEQAAPKWLFVQTASGFTSEGNTLTLPYEREIFGFTDRPSRMHAFLNASEFASLWGTGSADFSALPPNAVLTWSANDQIHEAEIALTAIAVGDAGRSITYTIAHEAGAQLPAEAASASLFVDASMAIQTMQYQRKILSDDPD